MKLPKQFNHWLKLARIKPEMRYRRSYYIGRNRRWRVNCHGQFEVSCPLPYFDRWANSRAAFVESVPTTERDFMMAVLQLLRSSEFAT